MAFSWSSLIPGVFDGIKQYFSRKHELRMKKLDLKYALTEAEITAKIELQRNRQLHEQDWEKMSIANSGWRDEYFTVFLSGMLTLVFIPGSQQVMIEGFKALENHTPLWFQIAFLGAVGSSFGIRVWDNFIIRKKKKENQNE